MRVGSNPLKNTGALELAPIVLAVTTHLPSLQGYHKDRLEIVKLCLKSMTQNAGMEYSLIVWDNGSIKSLTDWIEDEIKPDIFVKSVNVGKNPAKTAMANMIPRDRYFAYSDDDMYFYPNWLRPQIDTLNHFPGTAIVTGYPVRTAFRWGVENTLRQCRKFGKVMEGKMIPKDWEDDFALSIGRTPEFQEQYTVADTDYKVEYRGKQAFCTSHHCQFVTRAETIVGIPQYDGLALGDEKVFDIEMDKKGLRLATTERLTRHMGNVLDDKLRKDIGA